MKNILLFKLIVIVFIEICFFYSTAQTTNNWIQKSNLDSIPSIGNCERSCAIGFSIGNKAYVGLGYGDNYTKKADFWEYDQTLNTWSKKADFPGGVRSNAIGLNIGNKGYVGLGKDENIVKKDFWEYNPTTNEWTQKADFYGTAREGAIAFGIASKGYVGTGVDGNGNVTKDFWEYDPSINVWSQKADYSGMYRSYAVGFSIGNKGYIGTGLDINGQTKNDFWEYNPAQNIWTQKKYFGEFQSGICKAVGFCIGNKGYIGVGNFNNSKVFWEYDTTANKWTRKMDFAGIQRENAVGFSIGNKGYIATGSANNGTGLKFNDLWEYTPSTIGINNNELLSLIIIFPNPTQSTITISSQLNFNDVIIRLINVMGQSIIEKSDIIGNSLEFNISDYSSGLYFIEIIDNGNILRYKLFKE